jgi:hypothetical protein
LDNPKKSLLSTISQDSSTLHLSNKSKDIFQQTLSSLEEPACIDRLSSNLDLKDSS